MRNRNLERRNRNIQRDCLILIAYKSGQTLQEIGDKYGISRERIRVIIKKYGLTKKDGGIHKKRRIVMGRDSALEAVIEHLDLDELDALDRAINYRRKVLTPTKPLSEEEFALVKSGDNIPAIRSYKERNNSTLFEAKLAVDRARGIIDSWGRFKSTRDETVN